MSHMQVIWRAAAFGAALGLYGCATTPDALTPPVGANYEPGRELTDDHSGDSELALATGMMKAGDYSTAIPRLLHVMEKFPTSPAAIEARYHLGLAYSRIGGMRDAQQYFNEYLRLAPAGPFAEASRTQLATLADTATEQFPTVEQVQGDLEQARQTVQAKPDDLPAQLEMAELYWRSRQYEQAGEVYRHILTTWPSLVEDARIRTRMERNAAGGFTVITPEMGVQRQAENEPLTIFNTNSFRGGRFQSYQATSRETTYTVTGQVGNQSSDPLTQVEVIVTIYGFGNRIYDTQTISIGRLRPAESRPFSARFSNFDDIENISRFECVGTFER
jgi:Tfp pilus assembly protein PilF